MTELGTVIKSTGSWYSVRVASGEILDARIQGKFRLHDLDLTNPVAVGDLVDIEREEEEPVATIRHIHPRTNYVVRQSPHNKHQLHLLAANIDQACLIVTIRHPKLKPGFIDRFLMMTEPYDIPVILIFNKIDLCKNADLQVLSYLEEVYQRIDYQVIRTSAINKSGIKELKSLLHGKTTLIAGQSGVGKTSVLNALLPDLDLKTQTLSDFSGKGQHTTTFAEMFSMDEQSFIIDTPGIKTLAFNHLELLDVAHNFREIFEVSKDCKFSNCLHRGEPKCAVGAAVEAGLISEIRYGNYLDLLSEVEEQNYWERKKDV
ncbi:MAG: ribosome small subunit-dependent GTPase A [Saprospiraceae bacterium]|nr:ribosome small subunit-dependent GTPase A [Saprospiraceae bacterium]MCB9321503.1 ribosome small subunit-dependent GTPase A [Lewinellaceae bacterium]